LYFKIDFQKSNLIVFLIILMKLPLSLLFLFSFLFVDQSDIIETNGEWKLKKVKDGISVYTRPSNNGNLKEVKMELTLENTNLSKLLTVLGNVDIYKDWVYNLVESKTLHKESRSKRFDYFILDFPWPLSDRELFTTTTHQQDPTTKTLTIQTSSNERFLNRNKKYVLISNHSNTWIIDPIAKDQVKITYYFASDPAGSIPAWIVNMAIDVGPIGTMNALQKRLNSLEEEVDLEWIKEF